MTDPEQPVPPRDDARPEQDRPSAPSLPPPAFPPGSRRDRTRRRHGETSSVGVEAAPTSFDEPATPKHDLEEALISPDDPMPHRAGPGRGEEAPGFEAVDPGLVMGMGNDPHLAPEELVSGGDPHVMALTQKVGKLAQALRQRGEAGLRADPDMDRFDATLRAYCVGYLAGRRAEGG